MFVVRSPRQSFWNVLFFLVITLTLDKIEGDFPVVNSENNKENTGAYQRV